MHRRQFLASFLALPFLGLGQVEGISIGGWYYRANGLDCGTFLTFRAVLTDQAMSGLYTFFYDYLVDDQWLADFKESTVTFGCNSVWLPMVTR